MVSRQNDTLRQTRKLDSVTQLCVTSRVACCSLVHGHGAEATHGGARGEERRLGRRSARPSAPSGANPVPVALAALSRPTVQRRRPLASSKCQGYR